MRLKHSTLTLLAAAALATAAQATNLSLTPIGRFNPGTGPGGSEIVAHDPGKQRLFSVNASNRIDVISIANPAAPRRLFSIDTTPYGAQPNSVAVKNGLVAVAVQAEPKSAPGQVVFFDVNGKYLSQVTVGALPDMVTFTPDGKTVLVANEGEPETDYNVDPEGSVSIIRLPAHVRRLQQRDVTTINFAAFVGQPLDPSIRLFGPNANVLQNLEPEYITVSTDGRTAYVTLQENNALAILDLPTATFTALRGLGFKDHARVDASLREYEFGNLPVLGTTAAGQDIFFGGFSGLHGEGRDPVTGRLKFITHTDRGPNGEPTGLLRPFLLPGFAPEIVRFELDEASGQITITQRLALQRAPGVPLTGLPNNNYTNSASAAFNDEVGVDLFGNTLATDPLGGDFEGLVVNPADGTFWMVDEYRPALYQFDAAGVLLKRYVPVGTAAAAGLPVGTFGEEKLPAVLAQRRQNRGFEAIALDNGKLYAFVQSPLRNPTTLGNGALNAMRNVRILEFDPVTETTKQFIYIMDNPDLGGTGNTRADKIGDAVALGNGEFLVIERDDDNVPADVPAQIEKKIYRFNLAGVTDVSSLTGLVGSTGKTVDQLTHAELLSNNIRPVAKMLHVDLNAVGYNSVQKVEGLALIDPYTLAVINDNDFGVADITIDNATGTFVRNSTPEPIRLGIIDVRGNGLDASDRDGGKINIRQWPVKGLYQPDSMATLRVGRIDYLVTANEGDARDWAAFSEEKRVKDLTLDPVAFPDWQWLRQDSQIGRLRVTSTMGLVNGQYTELYAFGARSFSIWTTTGALVWDSGDDLEQIIAADPVYRDFFNANSSGSTPDERSDDKGPEPEAVAVGRLGQRQYAFIGLERIGGVMVYDVTDPHSPAFVQYVNSRDFSVAVGGDSGPEGLIFIEKSQSPIDAALLISANEISGTIAIFRVDRRP